MWWKLVWLEQLARRVVGDEARGESIALYSQWDGNHWSSWSRGGTQGDSQLRQAEVDGLDSTEELTDEDGVKE